MARMLHALCGGGGGGGGGGTTRETNETGIQLICEG